MHSGSSSSWSVDFHPPLDFALWCLQIDGLAVPPFDAHTSGTGQLVGAGLTPRLWVGWVRSLVGAHAEIGAVLAGHALSLSDPEALGAVKAAVETAVDPLARFEAQGPLRAELHTPEPVKRGEAPGSRNH